MGKKKGKFVKRSPEEDDSEEERGENPSHKDEDFFHDEVDDFHTQKNKILLDSGRSLEPAGISSDEQDEVLGLQLEESEDDDDDEEIQDYKERLRKLRRHGIKEAVSDSDDEEKPDEEDGLPDRKAWGKKKKKYYRSDSDSFDEASGSELEAEDMEEREALALQKKMAEELNDMDFDLDVFKDVKKTDKVETKEKIVTDVSQLPRSEKLNLLKKDSPEILELIEDYKTKMTELTTRLLPVKELITQGKISRSSGTDYIETKMALYMNYCVNVTFYLMLKAKHTPQVHSHPVVNRLVQYRNLMKQFEPADKKMQSELDALLEKIKSGDEPEIVPTTSSVTARLLKKAREQEAKGRASRQKKKKQVSKPDSDSEEEEVEEGLDKGGRSWGRKRKAENLTSGEREAEEFYRALKSGRKEVDVGDKEENPETTVDGDFEENDEDDRADGDGKRAVTYQILKNKGLRVHKKKENRNPRLKHRMKYRKANIRRRGQVREVRRELTPYGGEWAGIRAGLKRSVKMKA